MGKIRKIAANTETYAGKCEKCNGRLLVTDSRKMRGYSHRRWECQDCLSRFSTVEIPRDEYLSLVDDRAKLESIRAALIYISV
jgi:transcriptional regulator NrdR family protein